MIIYNNRRRQACRFKSHDVYKLLTLCVCALFLFSGIAFAQNQEIKKSAKSGTTSIDVKGMDVIDVLKILADDGGFNISIGSNVSGRVTLFLKDINVWDALEIVLAAGNLAYEKKGDIIYVMSDRDYELKYGNKYWDKRRLKVFTLKYRSAAKVKEMLLQVASSVGKVIVDEATNTIVVIDVEERIYQMADIIARLERPIETKVYELDYLPVKNLEQQ